MNLLSREALQRLIQTSGAPCVSIYLPADFTGGEVQQNSIRLKHLLREAEAGVADYGLYAARTRQILNVVYQLQANREFWQQRNGIAIFVTPGQTQYYALPIEFEEQVSVGDHFYLKPLLPLLCGDGRFYVLTLSQNEVRFFQGTAHSIVPIELNQKPAWPPEGQGFEDMETDLPNQTDNQVGTNWAGSNFHDQAMTETARKKRIQRFFGQIAGRLQFLLRNERVPLVLAGSEYLLPIYQEVNAFSYLLAEAIVDNPENLSPTELQRRAWQIIKPYFHQGQAEALAQYYQLAQTRRATTDVGAIVAAAHYGRIETLIYARGQPCWGAFNPMNNLLQLHTEPMSGDQDLVDLTVIQTLLNGGQVYAVEPEKIPGNMPLAAVFRYW
jgi:hypothetical protein